MRLRTAPLSRTERRWLIFAGLWCAMLLTVFALQQWQPYVVRTYERDKAEAERAFRPVQAKWNAEMTDLSRSILSRSGLPARKGPQDPATRAQLLERLFAGRTPGTLSYAKMPADAVAWEDPARDLVFVIRFTSDDVWRTFDVRSRAPVMWRADPPLVHPLMTQLESAWRPLVNDARFRSPLAVMWFALLLCTLLPSRRSTKFGHLQLAVALVCLLGCLIALDRPLTPAGVASNLAARWAAVYVGVAFVALRFAIVRASRPKPISPLCLTCGYDLTGNLSGKCPECATLLITRKHRLRPRPGPTSVLSLARLA